MGPNYIHPATILTFQSLKTYKGCLWTCQSFKNGSRSVELIGEI